MRLCTWIVWKRLNWAAPSGSSAPSRPHVAPQGTRAGRRACPEDSPVPKTTSCRAAVRASQWCLGMSVGSLSRALVSADFPAAAARAEAPSCPRSPPRYQLRKGDSRLYDRHPVPAVDAQYPVHLGQVDYGDPGMDGTVSPCCLFPPMELTARAARRTRRPHDHCLNSAALLGQTTRAGSQTRREAVSVE
jgi:hypothetical protein